MVFSNFHKIYDIKWDIEYYDFQPAFLTESSLSKPQNSEKLFKWLFSECSQSCYTTQELRTGFEMHRRESRSIPVWTPRTLDTVLSRADLRSWLHLSPHLNHCLSGERVVFISALSGDPHNTWAAERIHSPPVAFGFFGRNWTKLI